MRREYRRANTDWFASCSMGISVHWTALTAPRKGPRLPFADAVAGFDLKRFLGAVEACGADYVIFTAAHALQMLPCPHPVLDGIMPGRTAGRDLIGELADGLAHTGRKLIVYYNHSCNGNDDPPWMQAVGYHDRDKTRFVKNILGIVRWMGERYGRKISAWWFDSAYSLDPRGPNNSVTTDMTGFQYPWEEMTVAAKAGYPERLVTYNAGIDSMFLYTDHQDYWAGELVDLKTPPAGRYLDSGLQWHGWACLDDRAWVYVNNDNPPHGPLYSDEELTAFLKTCRRHLTPMCFNVMVYQDGTIPEACVAQLSRVRKAM